jgi:tetratricopeptide (TPR) repeat protein
LSVGSDPAAAVEGVDMKVLHAAHWMTLFAVLALAGCGSRNGDGEPATPDAKPRREAPLFNNLGDHQHSVTTRSATAQQYFNQGLILAFAFNHAESARAFQAAQRLDPDCAMCFWGEALALGPNINAPMFPEAVPRAWAAAQKAQELASLVTPREQAYIRALQARYREKPPEDRSGLDRDYRDAMRKLVQEYPDDLDAAALYAEAIMDTTAWNYWEPDGEPGPQTAELLRVLEDVLREAPNHPLALHLYIHAVEASGDPARGEAAADRLATLVPGAGHMVHMPAHIYMRVGRYADAADINARAAAADESYITQCRAQGFYPAAYYPHNVHFLWWAATAEGRADVAIGAAHKLTQLVTPDMVRQYAVVEPLLAVPQLALLQFGRWDALLAEPAPLPEFPLASALAGYAQGMALTAKGDLPKAAQKLEALRGIARTAKWDTYAVYQVPAEQIVEIAELLLDAELRLRAGDKGGGIERLRKAVARQDALPYMEPPYWDYSIRQSLGKTLLTVGLARDAEQVYREDLRRHPRNGWSLFGLEQALRAQGKTASADEVKRRFEQAWARADIKLVASRF